MRHHLSPVRFTCAAALIVTTAATPAAAAATTATPTAAASARAALAPPGANDWSCRPDRRHPQPVVLVNGTFETMLKNWSTLSPYLVERGYCVFAYNYGHNATDRMQHSARQMRRFVRRVRTATGARKVDIVGHSQGGMLPRWYIKFLGGRDRVDDLVGISPSSHGTTTPLVDVVAPICPACRQQRAGSRFMRRLNTPRDTYRGPRDTVIMTTHDEVVTPWRSQRLNGPRRRVTNVVLQHKCPTDPFEHDQTPNDPVVHQIVLNALRRRGPAAKGFRPRCL